MPTRKPLLSDLVAEANDVLSSDPERARMLATQAIERSTDSDRVLRGRAYLAAATACTHLGDGQSGLQMLLDGWDDHPDLVASFHRKLGNISSLLGHLDAALEAFDAAHISCTDESERWSIRLERANALRRAGRNSDAEGLYDELLGTEAPTPRLRAMLLLNAASCLHRLDRATGALSLLDEVEQLEQSAGLPEYEGWRHAMAAWAHLALGNPDQAVAFGQRALELPGEAGRVASSSATRAQAMALSKLGNEEKKRAVALLEQLATRLGDAGALVERSVVLGELAHSYRRQGNLQAAFDTLELSWGLRFDLNSASYERRRAAETARVRWLRIQMQGEELKRRNRELAVAAANLAMENEARVREVRQLAHDLRNPLTVIVGSLDLLPGGDPKLLNSLETQARRMWELLTVAMERTSSTEMQTERTDLVSLVRTVVDAYQPRARQKGVLLDVELHAMDDVTTDPSWLGRIVDNLVVNALKYADRGQQVQVGLTGDAVGFHLEVRDTGPGFGEQELGQVFDDGFVGSAAPTAGEPSTGHGLFVVKFLTEALGGTVMAANHAEGGAVVRVSVPR